MKTILKLTVACVFALLCCSCSNNLAEEVQPVQPILVEPSNQLFGVWEFGETIDPCGKKNSIEFSPAYIFAENHYDINCHISRYETDYTYIDGNVTMNGTTKVVTELTATRLVLAYPNGTSKVFTRKQ